jgi:hypothetical protein
MHRHSMPLCGDAQRPYAIAGKIISKAAYCIRLYCTRKYYGGNVENGCYQIFTDNGLAGIADLIKEFECTRPPPPCSAYDAATLHRIEPEIEIGALAPDIPLPHRFPKRKLSELRGTQVILVFSPANWDPSAAEQLLFLQKLLSECAPRDVKLRGLRYEEAEYFLDFDAPQG